MWTDTKYLQCADETAWQTLRAALGGVGPTNAAIFECDSPLAPWETPPVWGQNEGGEPVITTPGIPMAGFWVMLRLNDGWDGCAAALAAIEAAEVLRTLAEPPWVFA